MEEKKRKRRDEERKEWGREVRERYVLVRQYSTWASTGAGCTCSAEHLATLQMKPKTSESVH